MRGHIFEPILDTQNPPMFEVELDQYLRKIRLKEAREGLSARKKEGYVAICVCMYERVRLRAGKSAKGS